MTTEFSGSGGGGGSSRSPTRTPNNLLSQDYVELILGLGHGPWKGLVAGNKGPLQNLFLGDTAVQNISDGSANFADFRVAQFTGAEDEPAIERVLGGDSSNLNVGVTLASAVPVVRTTSPSLRKTDTFPGIDRLEVRLVFNQLVRSDDEGTFNHLAQFRIEYKATNEGTWKYYQGQGTTTVYGKTDGYVKDFLIPVTPLTNADYEVRVTKISPDNGTLEIVNMGWESLQMVTLSKPSYPGLAKLHIYGRVSEQFSSLPEISGIYEGFLIWVPSNYNPETRTYDESTPWNGQLVLRYSNNPAWVLYFLIKSTEYGLAKYYSNVSVILQEFYNAGKWCDEQVPGPVVGQTQPRFTFNELIDIQKSGIELLYYIAGSFNSIIYDSNNGVIRLKTDQMGVAKQLFTPETVVDGRFNYSFSDITTRYNDITVQYVNPDLDWEMDERSASVDTSEWIETNGRVPFTFVAVGCTNTHEAIRRANDRVITANTEITTVSFQTSRFGMLAELYDTILIADPVSGWSTGGRIKSHAGWLIQLRDPVYVTVVEAVTMKVQTYTGIVELQVAPPSTGLVYSLAVVGGTFPENLPDQAQFTIEGASGFGFAKPFRVIAVGEVDGSVEHFQISAVEINPNKYIDSANGTVSEEVKYDYTAPQEPRLPESIKIENVPPLVSTGGTLQYRIRVSWQRPRNAFTDHYEIDLTEADSGTTKTIVAFGEEIYLEPVKDLTYYSIRFYAVAPTGARSRFALENNAFFVTTKSVVLEDMSTTPGDFLLVQTPTGWRAGWSNPSNLLKDYGGVLLKYSFTQPTPPWSLCDTFGLSKPDENFKDLGWFEAGDIRILGKYTNTSGNESAQAVYVDLSVELPSAPAAVLVPTGLTTNVTLTDPTTTQPLKVIEVKIGSATSTWETASIDYFTVTGLTYSVVNSGTVNLKMFVRATDLAGNVGPVSEFTVSPHQNVLPTNQATVTLYQWGTSVPAAPTGDTTYTWATGINSGYTAADGWSIAMPSNPGTPLSKLWVVSKTITAAAGVATTTVSYSSLPRVAQATNGANGQAGTSGLQGATPTIYRWDISTPTPPIGNPNYTWATGLFGAAPSGWSLDPGTSPSPGYTLYASSVNLLEVAGVASTSFNWNAGVITARGAAGTNGASAKSLSLAASSQIFQVNNSGVSNPTSITFTATSQNLAGSPTFIATGGTLTGSGNTRTLTFANASSDVVSVQVSQDGFIDTITAVKVRDGTDSYVVLLSNESHTLPADVTGQATSYVGAETYITVLRGPNDDTANWNITSSTSGLTAIRSSTSGGGATSNGRFWRVSYQDQNTGYIDFTLSKSGVSTLYARMTSTLARKGTPGANSPWVKVTGDNLSSEGNGFSGFGIEFSTGYTSTAHSRGHTLWTQNLTTGGVGGPSYYDTYTSVAQLVSDLTTVPEGVIIMLYSWDATSHDSALRARLAEFGGPTDSPLWTSNRTSHVFIGQRGLAPGQAYSAISSATDASGVLKLQAYYSPSGLVRNGAAGATGSKGDKGDTGDQGGIGNPGNSYRTAYAVITGQSLSPSPSTYATYGSGAFPPPNTWGGGETWGNTVPSYGAGQSIQQIDGVYNPNNGQTLWSSPYLSAWKVGNLSVITTNTGALNVTGDMHMGSGGAISAGAFGPAWAWPSSGYGFHLSETGLLLGNPYYGSGQYFQVTSYGNLYSRNFTIENGQAYFSGELQAASGHFRGAITSGSFTTNYLWPTDGNPAGFHLGNNGLLLGNYYLGKYFQVNSDGNVYAPGFSIANGSATFSGAITGSVYQTATSGKRVTINEGSSNDVRIYSNLPGYNLMIARIGESYDPTFGYSFVSAGWSGSQNGVYGMTGTAVGGWFIATGTGRGLAAASDTGLAASFQNRATPEGLIGLYQGALMTTVAPELPQSGIGGARPYTHSMHLGIVAGGLGVNRPNPGGSIGTVLDTGKIIVTTNPAQPTGGNDGDMVIVV